MKLSLLIFSAFFLISSNLIYSQKTSVLKDTTLAATYFDKAEVLRKTGKPDSSLLFYNKAANIYYSLLPLKTHKNRLSPFDSLTIHNYLKTQNTIGDVLFRTDRFDTALIVLQKAIDFASDQIGHENLSTAVSYLLFGNIHFRKGDYSNALKYYFKSLEIRKKFSDDHSIETAKLLNNIGIVYKNLDEFDKAMEYYLKSLDLRKSLLGENHPDIASSYNNIAIICVYKGLYDKALDHHFKCLNIRKQHLGELHLDVAASYSNIGMVYTYKSEYDKALQYFFKCLEIEKKLLGENNLGILTTYNNIGVVSHYLGNYEQALWYYFKCLEITKKYLGENHISFVQINSNIGSLFEDQHEYDKAIEYYIKSLDIITKLMGNEHTQTAVSYWNIGSLLIKTGNADSALVYLNKSLQIRMKLFGLKHPSVAKTYYKIGEVFEKKGQYDKALNYYHLGTISNLQITDLINIDELPSIAGYFAWEELLSTLHGKARCLSKNPSGINNSLELSLRNYQLCDTLINITRKEITSLSDKITLGEKASQIYEESINVCLELAQDKTDPQKSNQYKQWAFYFSEKNKASVLLESLSGQQALQFAGIPDSLLSKEHDLRIDINFYNKQLAESPDSSKQALYRDRLFSLNRSYDSLIAVFETNYPEYYNLKYSETTASVPDIQKQLDESTAMVSYFAGDSMITIFTITHNSFDIEQKPTPKDFAGKIDLYRRSLTRVSALGQRNYKKLATEFYDLLIPKKTGKKIKQLIIVPDHALATIPFETFLTKPVTDKTEMHKLPYLVNQYAVSYSYSATLFMKTFPKEKTKKIEMHDLNDWLAFAPVADTCQTGMSLASRELLQRYQNLSSDSVQTRSLRDYFAPLPGTLSEVKTILDLFDKSQSNAKIEINRNADEKTIKSGLLKDYRILHFATHGMAHNEKPELSCILLASADSSDTENDGILYSGEIYNLKLNADLVVLSACETGLGKIKKGEGILGLTRALLYAGSKNIIVSLWQVADQSTSDMMVVFYDDLLKKGLSKSDYSKSLQQAKRHMIKNKQYAHPFYWSPFILIGK